MDELLSEEISEAEFFKELASLDVNERFLLCFVHTTNYIIIIFSHSLSKDEDGGGVDLNERFYFCTTHEFIKVFDNRCGGKEEFQPGTLDFFIWNCQKKGI